MIEHLLWVIAGLIVGLFVGYTFGKYRGASQVAEELGMEDETALAGAEKADQSPSEAHPDSTKSVLTRRGGSHYHREGCRHLRGRGQAMAEAQALKKGFRRCPSCRP